MISMEPVDGVVDFLTSTRPEPPGKPNPSSLRAKLRTPNPKPGVSSPRRRRRNDKWHLKCSSDHFRQKLVRTALFSLMKVVRTVLVSESDHNRSYTLYIQPCLHRPLSASHYVWTVRVGTHTFVKHSISSNHRPPSHLIRCPPHCSK